MHVEVAGTEVVASAGRQERIEDANAFWVIALEAFLGLRIKEIDRGRSELTLGVCVGREEAAGW